VNEYDLVSISTHEKHMHLKLLFTPEDFADDKNCTNHSEKR